MRRAHVIDVQWDQDENDCKHLPTDLVIYIPDYIDDDSIEDYVSDTLSDDYGYCHLGFDYYVQQ